MNKLYETNEHLMKNKIIIQICPHKNFLLIIKIIQKTIQTLANVCILEINVYLNIILNIEETLKDMVVYIYAMLSKTQVKESSDF